MKTCPSSKFFEIQNGKYITGSKRDTSFAKNDSIHVRTSTISFTYSGLHYIYLKAEQCLLDCFCQLRPSLSAIPIIDGQKQIRFDEKLEWNGVLSRLRNCCYGNMERC